jgi:hypothetical protein
MSSCVDGQDGGAVINGVHAIIFSDDAEGVREGFGLMTALRLPDGSELALYEPRHPSPLSPGD